MLPRPPLIWRDATSRDLPAVEPLLARDPVAHCFVASRVRIGGLDPWRLAVSCLATSTTTGCGPCVLRRQRRPRRDQPATRAAFADRLRPPGRRCSSFVGPAEEVLDLWRLLEPAWGPAAMSAATSRSCRPRRPPRRSRPAVRRATADDLDLLVPACIAMFTAEVGVSPVSGGMSAAYRARITEIVREGRSFVRIDDDDVVVFKAEVGAVARPRARCRASGSTRRTADGGCRNRGWPRWSSWPGRRSRRRCPCTSTRSTRRLAGLPSGGLPRARYLRHRPVLSRSCPLALLDGAGRTPEIPGTRSTHCLTGRP